MSDTLYPPQTFRKTTGIHRIGLAVDRPAATDVLPGTLYFSTDIVALDRSNGQTWDRYAATPTSAVLPPYVDLIEGAYPNPPANTERLYALDVNGYTQVEMKDNVGRGARLASDNILIAKVTEPTGAARGQLVYIDGAAGANALVKLAKADQIATMPTIGMILDTVPNNGFTRILLSGTLQGINTSAFAEGVSLYTSPTTAGALTDVFPAYPNYAQRVGFVTRSHATQGELLVLTTGTVTDPRLHHTTHETGGTDELLIGLWTDIPFNAANFTADTGTFVVTTQYTLAYTLLGKTLVYTFYLAATVTGSPSNLRIKLPAGLTAGALSGAGFSYGTAVGVMQSVTGNTTLDLYRDATGATFWVAGNYTLIGTITMRVP